jgi:hypothetical protein
MAKTLLKHDGGTRISQFEIKEVKALRGIGDRFVINRNNMYCGEAKTKKLVIDKLKAYLKEKGFKALTELQVSSFLSKTDTLVLAKGNTPIALRPSRICT